MNELRSSNEEYDIKEFYDKFVTELPKIIVVRHGYYGNAAMENFETGQVIRVEGASKQKRVVAKDITGRYLSLSVNHPIKCCFVDKKKKTHGKPMELAELIEKHKLPFSVKFGETDLDIFIGAVKKKADEYGPITLESVYEERFLMGNIVEKERFIPDIVIIPLYVKAIVSVIIGFESDATNKAEVDIAWQWFISSMEGKAKRLNYNGTKLTTEIAFYGPDQMVSDTPENIYDVISPAVYGSLYSRESSVTYETLDSQSKALSSFGKKEVAGRKSSRSMSVDSGVPTHNSACPPKIPPKPKPKPTLSVPQHRSIEEDTGKGILSFAKTSYKVCDNMSAKTEDDIPPVPSRPNPVPSSDYDDSGINEDISVFKKTRDDLSSETKIYRQSFRDIQSMSVQDVADVLTKLNLSQHIDSFRDNLVDGEILCDVDVDLLMSDFSFSKIQAIRLNKFIQTGHIPH